MNSFRLRRYALTISAAAILLAGCATPPLAFRPSAGNAVRARLAQGAMPLNGSCLPALGRGRSWMSPSAQTTRRLLYVSGCYALVYVYNYDSGALVGTLAGFNFPQGQCVDARGDVWIANFGEGSSGQHSSVVEYSHGGSAPLETLVTNGSSIGCSVAPNGDLAVSNFDRYFGYGPGNIQVWKNASGSPQEYTSTSCRFPYPPAYDPKGNLYVEGPDKLMTPTTSVCELAANRKRLRKVQVTQTITYANGAAWDGKYLVLSGQDYNGYATILYQTTEGAKGDLTVVGKTLLRDGKCESSSAGLYQPFIVGRSNTPQNRQQGHVLIAGDLACNYRFDFWKYPGGGNPFKVLANAPELSYGQSVSIAP